jgi:hypothetical protein
MDGSWISGWMTLLSSCEVGFRRKKGYSNVATGVNYRSTIAGSSKNYFKNNKNMKLRKF